MGESSRKEENKSAASAGPPIVGIGASAGGVNALQLLFEALPRDLGAALVVIVHLDPDSHSELAAILAAHCEFPVEQVNGTAALQANHVYVIPPDRQLRIVDHEISAVPFDEPRGRRAPIDLFFRSLAEQHVARCAVILTGAGSDGAVGVKAIKEAGGLVLVQDPDEAEYPSMPRAAIATDVADFVLPLRELADRLAEMVARTADEEPAGGSNDLQPWLRRILAHVRNRTGHDFSQYKQSTVHRRVVRRTQVTRTDSFEQYFDYLRQNPDESQALLADLLISVTTFFRDPDAFQSLATKVIPRLFDSPESAIRVWVAGCATGEEAYSLAMLLQEEAGRHDFRPEMQVFASDLDSGALAIAREGHYPSSIRADVSDERLKRFFTEDGEFFRVKRELRDMVLFANHSLLKDPPFSRVDLLSCRNLLIYLEREMQQQVLSVLHYGLNPHGFLFLGSSESADHPRGFFRPVDRDFRIFQSTGRTRDQLPMLPPRLQGGGAETRLPPGDRHGYGARAPFQLHRDALETAAPPSILVDQALRVVHISETAGRYLQPQGGPLSTDVTELVRQELRLDLRVALNGAFERGETSLSPPIFVRFNGAAHRTYVQVRPLAGKERERRPEQALVLFIEGQAEEFPRQQPQAEAGSGSEKIHRLEQEMELMQLRLQTTRQDSEAATEELRAANEELQSINEEYRSTAEELETSKEELQSINEELQTVNSELKLKLESVSRANSDLQNLMAAADFGTLFLDPALRIKLFTPRIADLFNIAPGDIGRPLSDLTNRLEYRELTDDARQVLQTLIPLEREVRSREGGCYIVRVRPYRTADDRIDGVVAAFVDITERRRAEDALRESERLLKQQMRLVELSEAPIFIWDLDDGIVNWNRGSEDLYGYTREEAIRKPVNELLKTTLPDSSFDVVREQLLETGSWNGELRQVAKDGRPLVVESRLEFVPAEEHRYVLESGRDVSESKRLERRQELLVGELTHRVKNLLTVTQGMVHQTAKSSRSIDEFVTKLDGRLSALANSQKLVVNSVWEGADLRELVEYQLAPYVDGDGGRLQIEGDPMILPADVATPFGLIFHELATNAAKYGAFSGPRGRIELRWRLDTGNDRRVLKVLWVERDGPPVRSRPAPGFGSQLITNGLPGATVKHEYLAEGVQCSIELPLP